MWRSYQLGGLGGTSLNKDLAPDSETSGLGNLNVTYKASIMRKGRTNASAFD
ncbi:unnamed protein product [Musa banksii]